MQIATCISTTQGLRVEHQDRTLVEESVLWGQPATVLAVADGMGGLEAGGIAAELAVESVRVNAHRDLPLIREGKSPRLFLRRLFQDANLRIWDFSLKKRIESRGTTLVVALLFGDRYLVAHVGDSRCYAIEDGAIRRLTDDHSVAEQLVKVGQLTAGTGLWRQYRSQLTRCLGEEQCAQVDIFPARRGYGRISVAQFAFLLCSDGLYGELEDAEILDQMRRPVGLQERCSSLVLRALKNGSTDNITLVAAELGE
ncbi:MAG: serine/threonine-protein phosphatase [Acidobacteria bacterium]|nr:MAG: serine/threonine-protein phosphatase [Acidobacteriota bacterium]